jgi:hypothetical protein
MELSLTNSHTNELQSRPILSETFKWVHSPVNTLTIISSKTLRHRHKINCTQIPNPQTPWDNKCLLF